MAPENVDGPRLADALRASEAPVLVLVCVCPRGMPGCGCASKAFEAVASNRGARLLAFRVDGEAEQAMVRRFGISAMPTILLFYGGMELARLTGAIDETGLDRWLAEREARLRLQRVRAEPS